MNTRIVELDFVKGVFITLMVLCHLSLFVMTYKDIVSWVYDWITYFPEIS